MAKEKDEEVIVDVTEAYSKSEQWVIENQKSLIIIAGAVLLLVVSYFAYNNFIYKPQEQEAQEQMWQAEKAFAQDSLNVALNGNAVSYGFLDIIDQYSITESANLAHYYAGICYLRLGEYDNAITYLEDFDCNDVMVCAVALGATGDAYMELGQVDKALDYYRNAVDHSPNELTTPIFLMKAARAHETVGDLQDALDLYEKIKSQYPTSSEARSIDKFIARIEGQMSA